MTLILPFDEPRTALIDVRHGGDAAAAAMMAIADAKRADAPAGIAVYRGIDDDKVLTYGQWEDPQTAAVWLAATRLGSGGEATAGRWAARLFRLDSSANRGPLDLAADDATIAHTGLFAMLGEEALIPFLAKARDAAAAAVAAVPDLLSANFHASLDGTRAVNLGFWRQEQGFRDLVANPPFVNRYWEGLADNEPGFYRRVWVRA